MTKSIYDQLNAYGTVAKQRFVENFSGDALDTDRWSTVDNLNSNTYNMSDSVDGGFSILTNASASSDGAINFNSKRQYSHNGSVCISVVQATTLTGGAEMYFGLNSAPYLASGSLKHVGGIRINAGAFFAQSNDGTTNSSVTTGVSKDASWHSFKTELDGTDLKAYVDGVLKVTKTTNMPGSAMQPGAEVYDGSMELRIKYMEAYNT